MIQHRCALSNSNLRVPVNMKHLLARIGTADVLIENFRLTARYGRPEPSESHGDWPLFHSERSKKYVSTFGCDFDSAGSLDLAGPLGSRSC